jgi:hypothetical protein
VIVDAGGVPWGELEVAAPEVTAAGRRLLEDAPGVPGAAFLATVGVDGTPRVHPFVPAVTDGAFWAFVVDGPKQRDLDRTGRYAIHSCLGERDESFFCAGRAICVNDEVTRARIAEVMPYSDVDDRHRLYELRISKALWTVWTTPTEPVYRRWSIPRRD